MSRIIQNSLLLLGCNVKQIKFYMSCLELGNESINAIAKHAGLQRSTAYLIAEELLEKGLILEDHKSYKKSLTAIEPDVLLRKLEAKHRQIGRQSIDFKENLPELRALHQATAIRPRVRTYQGIAGLAGILKDILSSKTELLLWTNQASEQKFFDNESHRLFIQERINKQIPIRVLAVNNEEGNALAGTDDTNLRTTKLLPNSVDFTSETYIYGNKIATIDVSQDIFGIITENEQIAASQRAIFELNWSQIERV